MEKIVFGVEGMKCVHCKNRVEDALKAIDGVKEAVASLEEKNVTVEFEANKVSEAELKGTIEDSGYEAL